MEKQKTLVSRKLPVKLMEFELLNISKELARANQELSSIMNQKKEMNAGFAAKQKISEGIIEDLSLKISTGQEYRDVDCRIEFDEINLKKTLFRTDTDEIVEKVKMTTEDLQKEIQFYSNFDETY